MQFQHDLIFDVGMHNGDDSAYYLHRGYRVVAIEADPALAEAGRRRFAREIAAGRLTLLNIGIGPQEGTATFWICDGKSEWNSFDRQGASRGGHASRPIEIPCRRFANVLREFGVPHYLKIDIESHDKHCLADLCQAALPTHVSVELTSLADLFQLNSLQYDAFKLVLQGRHTAARDESRTLKAWGIGILQQSPLLMRLSRKVGHLAGKIGRAAGKLAQRVGLARRDKLDDWVFPLGSSGPFGEEAPGEWIGFEETVFRWLALERIYPGEVWCDVHATRRVAEAAASRRHAA